MNHRQLGRSAWRTVGGALTVALLLVGCGRIGPFRAQELLPAGAPALENPLFIPQPDAEIVWNQLVDELDDYFRTRREERVRIIDNVQTEGWIETFPATGGTWLEPWRTDSTPGFERWQSTLQSIRRWARVRMIPAPGGFRVEVAVYKELEDLEQPQHASVGGSTRRYDNSRERDAEGLLIGPDRYGWIPQGRDTCLEQRILANLLGRLTGPPR